jgi:hypothetical protein
MFAFDESKYISDFKFFAKAPTEDDVTDMFADKNETALNSEQIL